MLALASWHISITLCTVAANGILSDGNGKQDSETLGEQQRENALLWQMHILCKIVPTLTISCSYHWHSRYFNVSIAALISWKLSYQNQLNGWVVKRTEREHFRSRCLPYFSTWKALGGYIRKAPTHQAHSLPFKQTNNRQQTSVTPPLERLPLSYPWLH